MQSKRGNIFVAVVFFILCFSSVVYVSCTKTGGNPACDGVVCLNSGFCNKGKCVCPVGFEGNNCSTAAISKYIGTWDAREVVTGSDHPGDVGKTKNYTLFFKNTATPTTFFINNFLGKPDYNQILGVLDSNNSYSFYLDTLRPIQMWFDQVIIKQPSKGVYDGNSRTITTTVVLRYINASYNWQVDTITITLTPHNF